MSYEVHPEAILEGVLKSWAQKYFRNEPLRFQRALLLRVLLDVTLELLDPVYEAAQKNSFFVYLNLYLHFLSPGNAVDLRGPLGNPPLVHP